MTGPALVLGATGLIGAHVRAELEGRGLAVVGTSRSGERETTPVDVTDADAVSDLIAEVRPSLIVHAAGMSSVAEAWQRPADAFRINTTGTLNLLEALRRHAPEAHFILTSSAGVYGSPARPEELPFTEASPVRPLSPYAASKAAAEVLCGQYEREHGSRIAVVRIFNTVGPGQDPAQAPSEFAREIALAERSGASELALPVGNPEVERDFTDVRDTAKALADLAEAGSTGTFNLCSGYGSSLGEIVRLLGEATPLEISVAANPDHHRPNDVPRIFGSAAKLEATTGWRPRDPLADSLAALLEDWRERIR